MSSLSPAPTLNCARGRRKSRCVWQSNRGRDTRMATGNGSFGRERREGGHCSGMKVSAAPRTGRHPSSAASPQWAARGCPGPARSSPSRKHSSTVTHRQVIPTLSNPLSRGARRMAPFRRCRPRAGPPEPRLPLLRSRTWHGCIDRSSPIPPISCSTGSPRTFAPPRQVPRADLQIPGARFTPSRVLPPPRPPPPADHPAPSPRSPAPLRSARGSSRCTAPPA
jgi:hypothetical protein